MMSSSHLRNTLTILHQQPKLLIFAKGKLDSKRRLVKLLKRDAKVFDAVEAKEQELRQYFQKWSQKQGLQFANHSFENLLVKSGFQFSEIQKKSPLFTVL